MAHEARAPLDVALHRRSDCAHDVRYVNQRVRRIAAADEREETPPGHLKERVERAVARSVHDAGSERYPAELLHRGEHALALELALAVRRDRVRRVVL